MSFLPAITAAFLFFLADTATKLWALAPTNWRLFGGMLALFAAAGAASALAVQVHTLTLSIAFINVFSFLAVMAAGYFYFGERLNPQQYLGLGFALIAILLLSIPLPFFKHV